MGHDFVGFCGFCGFDTAWDQSFWQKKNEKRKNEKKGHLLLVVLVMFHSFEKETKDETTYPRLGMMGMDFKWR